MGTGHGDEGAVLLLVLVVTTVLAVVIGVLLSAVEVNLRNTSVAVNIDDKTYAADGGVEYAIQMLRQDATVCAGPTSPPWSLTVKNIGVDVTCATTAGIATAPSNWAAVVGDQLSTPFSAPTALVAGSTYVGATLKLQSDLDVTAGGNVPEAGLLLNRPSPCASLPHVVGAPNLLCATLQPTPVVNVKMPDVTLVDRGHVPTYLVGAAGDTCGIFLPGKYSGGPLQFGTHNYFASGIYYFENVDIHVDGIDVIGGNPGASETALVDSASSACADDRQVGVSDGSGVEWILGGTSALSVGSSSGTALELFSRVPATASNGPEGTAGVSIRTVPAGTAGYVASTPGSTVFANSAGGGQVGVHGLVYAPDSTVQVGGTTHAASPGAKYVLSGGVVARELDLTSAGDHNLVSQADADSHRFVSITSTAQGTGSEKDVITTAVVEIGNDAERTVVIDSWVTNEF
jgi:hypothetical protein